MGRELLDYVLPGIEGRQGLFVVSIGGESGSGKSELAEVLHRELKARGIGAAILQQDDYFVYPPRTNDALRRQDLERVGMEEVRLLLLNRHVLQAKSGARYLRKPLVLYDEDRIIEHTLDLPEIGVLIVEGTYTTILEHVDLKVFIERNYHDTREDRGARAREPQDAYLEQILAMEHAIISAHRSWADILVTRDYQVVKGPRALTADYGAGDADESWRRTMAICLPQEVIAEEKLRELLDCEGRRSFESC